MHAGGNSTACEATTSVSTYGLTNHSSVNKATIKTSENIVKKPIFFTYIKWKMHTNTTSLLQEYASRI